MTSRSRRPLPAAAVGSECAPHDKWWGWSSARARARDGRNQHDVLVRQVYTVTSSSTDHRRRRYRYRYRTSGPNGVRVSIAFGAIRLRLFNAADGLWLPNKNYGSPFSHPPPSPVRQQHWCWYCCRLQSVPITEIVQFSSLNTQQLDCCTLTIGPMTQDDVYH